MEQLSSDVIIYLCVNFLDEHVSLLAQTCPWMDGLLKSRRVWDLLWRKREGVEIAQCTARVYNATRNRTWEFGCRMDKGVLDFLASFYDVGARDNRLLKKLCDENNSEMVKYLIEKYGVDPSSNNHYAMRLFTSHINEEMIGYLERWSNIDVQRLFVFAMEKSSVHLLKKYVSMITKDELDKFNRHKSLCLIGDELIHYELIDIDFILKNCNTSYSIVLSSYILDNFIGDPRMNLEYLTFVRDENEFLAMTKSFRKQEEIFWPSIFKCAAFVNHVYNQFSYYLGNAKKATGFFNMIMTKKGITPQVKVEVDAALAKNNPSHSISHEWASKLGHLPFE